MTIERIDVRDLLGQPGASRTVELQGTVEGLGTELATLPADEPVTGLLLLESVVEGVLVSGSLHGVLSLRCARCLVEFGSTMDVEVNELFALAPEEGDEDVYALDPDGWIDPEQLARDALGLELPFSPLHSPDCRGICSVCGGDRNRGECPGDHDDVDPRWSALELVLQDLEDRG